MARYALISAGTVVNVVDADAAWVAAQPLQSVQLDAESTVGPGWGYAGGNFTAPPAPAPVVPPSITRRQARQVLVLNGVSLATVDAVIAALPEPTKTIATIFWADSNEFERNNAMLLSLAPLVGLSSQQLDLLFIQAAGL
jgi:hypothetical protein